MYCRYSLVGILQTPL